MAKVIVRKDHDLDNTLQERQQKFLRLVCMIPGWVGDGVRGGEKEEEAAFAYMLVNSYIH